MSRKITFLTLFLWLMTVTFPVIAQQKACLLYTSTLQVGQYRAFGLGYFALAH